jgi:hypothetical protein
MGRGKSFSAQIWFTAMISSLFIPAIAPASLLNWIDYVLPEAQSRIIRKVGATPLPQSCDAFDN